MAKFATHTYIPVTSSHWLLLSDNFRYWYVQNDSPSRLFVLLQLLLFTPMSLVHSYKYDSSCFPLCTQRKRERERANWVLWIKRIFWNAERKKKKKRWSTPAKFGTTILCTMTALVLFEGMKVYTHINEFFLSLALFHLDLFLFYTYVHNTYNFVSFCTFT